MMIFIGEYLQKTTLDSRATGDRRLTSRTLSAIKYPNGNGYSWERVIIKLIISLEAKTNKRNQKNK